MKVETFVVHVVEYAKIKHFEIVSNFVILAAETVSKKQNTKLITLMTDSGLFQEYTALKINDEFKYQVFQI